MIKEKLKKVKFIEEMYIIINNLINRILLKVSPVFYSKRIYRQTLRKSMNLKEPKEFNEKLMWLKFNKYNNNKLVTQCADKYKVREYIEECDCKEILNELIGVYNNAEQIEWNTLPNKFVLKCNHGAGYNIICNNKNKLNEKSTKNKLNKWLHEDYSKIAAELQYRNIHRKIICEKYIDMGNNKLPTDYKFYCFNGRVKVILVMNDRESTVTREFYNEKWKRLHLRDNESSPKNPTLKPENLDLMIDYAEKLSKPFEFVRVDLYNVSGKIIFGELTFTPTGCLAKYTDEASKMLGDWIQIKKEEKI